ncbi:hypothetical protein LINPERHAP1_LOCUS5245 [Linum perenne]
MFDVVIFHKFSPAELEISSSRGGPLNGDHGRVSMPGLENKLPREVVAVLGNE